MQRTKKNRSDIGQTELFGIVWQPARHSFRLRAGDVIRYNGKLCLIIRVNECAAVVLMNQPTREFTTRFDKPVRFRAKPALFRISPNSDVEIVNRQGPKRIVQENDVDQGSKRAVRAPDRRWELPRYRRGRPVARPRRRRRVSAAISHRK